LQDYQAALLALPNSNAQMTNFIGGYLTAAKNHVMFMPPEVSVTPAKFARDAAKYGLRLDLRSRMMQIDSQFFINGFEAGMDANKMPTVDVKIALPIPGLPAPHG
jgi:hypothetical protein